jgi:hypothetical protein
VSVKIFVAWRVPLRRLTEASKILHDQMFDLALTYWGGASEAVVVKSREENPDDSEWEHRYNAAFLLIGIYQNKVEKHQAGDLDCGFHVWTEGRYAYLIPWGFCLFRITVPDWFEDYSYVNSGDLPADPKERRRYNARLTRWNRLYLEAKPSLGMTHDVVEVSNLISLMDLQHAYLDEIGFWKKEDRPAEPPFFRGMRAPDPKPKPKIEEVTPTNE